jgi:hypothetical protein
MNELSSIPVCASERNSWGFYQLARI